MCRVALVCLLLCFGFPSPAQPQCPFTPSSAPQSVLILVAGREAPSLNASLAVLGSVLNVMGLDVDVAFNDDRSIAAVCRRHHFNTVELFATSMSYELNARFVRRRHTFRRYSLFIWLTDDLMGAMPYFQTLPAASSLLWALGPSAPWPHGRSRNIYNFQQLIQFDYVWFNNADALHLASLMVNPMGHQPPSFRLVSSSLPPEPSTLHFLGLAVRQLVVRGGIVERLKQLPPVPVRRWFRAETVTGAGTHAHDARAAHPRRDTCPNRRGWARIALAVHLASRPVVYLHPVFNAMHAMLPMQSHLWLTFFNGRNRGRILQAFQKAGITGHLLGVRNKGLDIGPFFLVLWQIITCNYIYDYILKFHFKTSMFDPMAVQAAMYFHIPTFLKDAVEKLDNEPGASAVYPHIRQLYMLVFPTQAVIMTNKPYMTELSEALHLPWASELIVGTVFLGRLRSFTSWFGTHERLWELYLQLTDFGGLDWRWYNHFYFNDQCDRAAVEWHFLHVGMFNGFYGNVYAVPDCHTMFRDGMVEHAWERILSFMLSTQGDLTPLPVPYSCHPAHTCPSLRPRA